MSIVATRRGGGTRWSGTVVNVTEEAAHRGDVKYARDRFIDLGPDTRVEWKFLARSDGTYEAFGPCPECNGTAYGPRLAEIQYRESDTGTFISEQVDVVCECHCDFDHGGPDTGCGRWWIASSTESKS